MNYNDFSAAVDDAKNTLSRADRMVEQIGYLLPDRLRLMSPLSLVKMKRELQDFDSRTQRWKEKK